MPEQLFLRLLQMSLPVSWLVLAVLVLRMALKKAPSPRSRSRR